MFATNGTEIAPTGGLIENQASTALTHAGFRNPDGSFVVVLANRGSERKVQLVHGSNALDLDMPADSLFTMQWG